MTFRGRSRIVRVGVALLLAAAGLTMAAFRQAFPAPLGFSKARGARYAELERRFVTLPSPDRLREAHRVLTEKPHPAGSERDGELAQWMRDRFDAFGLENVSIVVHEVLLPWPEEVSVEMTAPKSWRASLREDPIPGDRDTHAPQAELGIPYHAYSAVGDVTAPVVYAGRGTPADYEWLETQGVDVRGKIALVRHSSPYSYRGFKVWTAERRGAAGILIYSDPAEDGQARGKVYPAGPWGPEGRIQRGGVGYDFLVPGDPLTPGWPSTPEEPRIALNDAVALPKIVSAPLSERDARVILQSLGGPVAPDAWGGKLPITYRAGPGPARVRLKVRTDNRIRPVWTVTGMIRGSDDPDSVVILGNHRDAWVYGAVDPSSGSAALIELARTLGELKRTGWRPRRSILFASWDAEEFSLTSSTEWGEQHRAWLEKAAVAYLNVDSAVSGGDLAITAVPALNPLIEEVTRVIRDPASRLTLAARARDRATHERGVRPTGSAEDFVRNRLGGGSDYTVFLNHLGVPVADLTFEGPYGVYHSSYDTHDWVARFGDPGFRYHATLVQLWGTMAMRLADADAIPLDYAPYAERIQEFARELARDASDASRRATLAGVHEAAERLFEAAVLFNGRRTKALEDSNGVALQRLNRQLMAVERAFIDREGLPSRPWYRHLIYAPQYTYEPQILPGVSGASETGDAAVFERQARRLVEAIRAASALLEQQ